MPINAGYEYFNAEKQYDQASTIEEKIAALEEMIRTSPGHKGAENLRAELRLRLKKLREKSERVKKTGKGAPGLKKEGFQVALLGMPNSGKSSLLEALTNARSASSPHPFTTHSPVVGTMDYKGVKSQIVDLPSVGNSTFDIGIVNTADCVALVIDSLDDIPRLEVLLARSIGKKLIVFSKIDLMTPDELRKLKARCSSKKIELLFCSSVSGEGIDELKQAIFRVMNKIRVYTKEPGKQPSAVPVVLPPKSTVRDVAESIRNGFSKQVSEARVTGPSAAFAHQKVGLGHVLKDLDTVEFKTR